MVQSSVALADLQASYIAIYLTMVFAYTTVAYVAGKQLSRLQVSIATLVYLAAAFYVAGVIVSISANLITYSDRIREIGVSKVGQIDEVALTLWFDAAVWPLLMIASLIFMWNVRKDK